MDLDNNDNTVIKTEDISLESSDTAASATTTDEGSAAESSELIDADTATSSEPVQSTSTKLNGAHTATSSEPVQCTSTNGAEAEDETGPLGRLSKKAYQSALVQKASDKIPSSVRPILKRGAEEADRAIAVVDETLQTDEARRVAGSAMDFVQAVGAFTLMVLSMTATRLESMLNIPAPSSSTESQEGTQTEQREAEPTGQREKAIQLFCRYKTIVQACFRRVFTKKPTASSSLSSETESASDRSEQSRYDPHSLDKVVVNNMKQGLHFAKQVGAYSLSKASQFTGPGSSTIAPTADFIISKLPEDTQRVVTESRSPFQ